jgi:hypothetical protein
MYACDSGAAAGHLCPVRTSVRLAAIDWDMPAWGNALILLGELAALRIGTYFALRWRLR